MLSKSLRAFLLVIIALPAVWLEARAAAANSLANVSTRGQVGTGESALQVSFTVEGTSPKSVLVRGLGPALAVFGISGTLANPVVTVHDGSGAVVASNADRSAAANRACRRRRDHREQRQLGRFRRR